VRLCDSMQDLMMDLNSLFNADLKFVGHECLMQSFDQSVNQLVSWSVVRLCDCKLV
jgi:hypothetical protein